MNGSLCTEWVTPGLLRIMNAVGTEWVTPGLLRMLLDTPYPGAQNSKLHNRSAEKASVLFAYFKEHFSPHFMEDVSISWKSSLKH